MPRGRFNDITCKYLGHVVGVLRKKILSSTFQYDEMIENKEKIRAGPIDLGGPIKPHS